MSLRCFFLFGMLFCTTTAQNTCATFQFPTIIVSTLIVAENTTVSLPFTISDLQNCQKNDRFRLQVSRIAQLTHIQCIIIQENGTCYYPVQTSKCECTEQPGHYRLTHTIDRSDSGVWLWSSDYKDIQTTTLNFTVLCPRLRLCNHCERDPPRVTKLTITQNGSDVKLHPAEERSTVDVDCEWEDGNPTSNVSLLDRHGKQIARGGYSDGHLRRNIHDVRCEDAGSIQCVGPSATENKTATLLVKCAPDLTGVLNDITVLAGEDKNLSFPLRTHTTEVQECTMHRDPETENANITDINCTSFVAVIGTPPDLSLTVRLENVRKQDEGQWRLELTNDAGTGLLNIGLEVVEVPSDMTLRTLTTSTLTGTERIGIPLSTQHTTSAGQISVNIVVIIGVGIAVFVLLNVTISIVCGLKARRFVPQSRPVQELAMVEQQAVGARRREELEERVSGQSVHEYFYVPDSPPTSASDEFADDEPPPPICHGPSNPPDDYLVPEPSRDETEEEGAEWKTVRYYENTQLKPVGATGASCCAAADSSLCTETGASDDAMNTNCVALADVACDKDENIETDETEYVRYSPPLYENTMS